MVAFLNDSVLLVSSALRSDDIMVTVHAVKNGRNIQRRCNLSFHFHWPVYAILDSTFQQIFWMGVWPRLQQGSGKVVQNVLIIQIQEPDSSEFSILPATAFSRQMKNMDGVSIPDIFLNLDLTFTQEALPDPAHRPKWAFDILTLRAWTWPGSPVEPNKDWRSLMSLSKSSIAQWTSLVRLKMYWLQNGCNCAFPTSNKFW